MADMGAGFGVSRGTRGGGERELGMAGCASRVASCQVNLRRSAPRICAPLQVGDTGLFEPRQFGLDGFNRGCGLPLREQEASTSRARRWRGGKQTGMAAQRRQRFEPAPRVEVVRIGQRSQQARICQAGVELVGRTAVRRRLGQGNAGLCLGAAAAAQLEVCQPQVQTGRCGGAGATEARDNLPRQLERGDKLAGVGKQLRADLVGRRCIERTPAGKPAVDGGQPLDCGESRGLIADFPVDVGQQAEQNSIDASAGIPVGFESLQRTQGRRQRLMVQGAMPRDKGFEQALCADISGFSLHAAVRCSADDRQALEQLCRYITRPALANERVQPNAAGQVVLKLKTPPGATAPGIGSCRR